MEPLDIVYDICRYYINDLVQEVDSDLIALIRGYHRSRNHAELSSCSRHFDWHSHSIREWRFLRQVEAFFKKNALLADSDICFSNAKDSFMEAEALCSETNVRLHRFVRRPHLLGGKLYRNVQAMQSYISRVLGDYHSFINDIPSLVRVTSGATSTSSRRNSLPQLKLRPKLFCTIRTAPMLKALGHIFGFKLRAKTTMTNRVELVPKNWKTDRTIACEPEGNLPFQLAFDSYAKKRLRYFGIDLSDQSANQRAARDASISGKFVTVDFSKASDTISYNTVSLVFPVDWFSFLDKVRTPLYRGVFGRGVYSKFSSMGNGSTFTIETLLFAAACYAVGSRNFLVYGDDVIIEKEFYEDYIALTRFLGFTINVDKSFHEGPFRESCGGDYFNGIDVTPVYIRNIDKRKASFCHLINTIGSIAELNGSLMAYLCSLSKELNLPLVPFNDSTLSGVWIDPARARALGILRHKRCIDTFKAYTPKYKRRSFVDSRGYYLWFLNKTSQVLFSGPWELNSTPAKEPASQTSSATVYQHAYVRKRVSWFVPAGGIPVHVYTWTELIARASRR